MQQFLTDVYFGDLDVLLLDLPPGTGDVAISLGQLLPQAEVLVVTTPQPAAAEVAERSGLVARQTGQTVIGVVENMAGLAQADGTVLELFGSGGGAELAARLSAPELPVPVMATIPLSVALRSGGDAGAPVVLSHPDDPAAAAILRLAEALAGRSRGLAGRQLPIQVNG
jgi:ATP-binding protein involved in chromosome partitioning